MSRSKMPPTLADEEIERIANANGDYMPDSGAGCFIFDADPDCRFSIYTFARALIAATEAA